MPARHRLSTVPAPRSGLLAALLAAVALAAALAALLAPAARAATFMGEPVVGPLGQLKSLSDLDLAPDGGGALVFVAEEGGADHVFVSRLWEGAWSRLERLDGSQGGPSAPPVVSTGNNGRIAVAWVNGGNLHAVTKPAFDRPWSAPQTVWSGGGASDPSIDLSVNKKGYLAFTAPGAGGHDVRVAYSRDAGQWTLVGAPLDADANADAGSGLNRPRVGAAADGIGVVTWGEGGRVWARRVQGTRPSVVAADAHSGLVVEGVQAATLDTPVVGTQDDDSFTGIAFRATFEINGAPRTRVVLRRLRGSRFEDGVPADTTPFGSGQSSINPAISNGGVGQGIVLGSGDASNLSYALLMRADLLPGGPVVQVDSITPSSRPTYAVPATATPLKMLVAWQFTGADGATDVRHRFYNGREFEAETVLSNPAFGPTRADRGLLAAGDDQGDLVVAYVQDVPGQGPVIAVATIDQPPGRFEPKAGLTPWQRTDRPVLAWTRPRETWGLGFKVVVDGAEVGRTNKTSFTLPNPVAQGQHSWQVTAVDRRGQEFAARPYTVRVDSVAPTASVRVSGSRRAGEPLRLTLKAADPPPPPAAGAQPAATSGVGTIVLDWGDRSRREPIKAGSQHVYARPGTYTIRLSVLDKAGNRTEVREVVRIAAPSRARRGAGADGRDAGDAPTADA